MKVYVVLWGGRHQGYETVEVAGVFTNKADAEELAKMSDKYHIHESKQS